MRDRLIALFEPVVEAEGAELVDIEYKKEGTVWVVRVFVDREGGIDLDAISRVSRSLSTVLDVEDLISRKYTLEVSSPGACRPLKKAGDYRRFLGNRIKVKLFSPLEGRKNWVGILQNATPQTIELAAGSQLLEIPVAEIAKAHLEPEFFKNR